MKNVFEKRPGVNEEKHDAVAFKFNADSAYCRIISKKNMTGSNIQTGLQLFINDFITEMWIQFPTFVFSKTSTDDMIDSNKKAGSLSPVQKNTKIFMEDIFDSSNHCTTMWRHYLNT